MVRVEPLTAPSNLMRRTVTALVLAPLAIAAILWLPTPVFAALVLVIVLFAAWEWAGLAGASGWRPRVLYVAVIGLATLPLWIWPQWLTWLLLLGAFWWAVQAARLPGVRQIDPAEGVQLTVLAAGALVLVGLWAALLSLHRIPGQGPGLVLFLMILIWTADSAAFFVGRTWGGGRARLAPVLSPAKTRVGLYGALIGAVMCGVILGWLRSASLAQTLLILLVCVISVAISVIGDLYESFLKRRRGLKDSGQLLPGHGGMLDRIDSLTAAAPVFVLGITLALA